MKTIVYRSEDGESKCPFAIEDANEIVSTIGIQVVLTSVGNAWFLDVRAKGFKATITSKGSEWGGPMDFSGMDPNSLVRALAWEVSRGCTVRWRRGMKAKSFDVQPFSTVDELKLRMAIGNGNA